MIMWIIICQPLREKQKGGRGKAGVRVSKEYKAARKKEWKNRPENKIKQRGYQNKHNEKPENKIKKAVKKRAYDKKLKEEKISKHNN